jgi:hypothetical protein
MTLRAAGVVPPMRVPVAPLMVTPVPLAVEAIPVALVPMKFPWMVQLDAATTTPTEQLLMTRPFNKLPVAATLKLNPTNVAPFTSTNGTACNHQSSRAL